MSLSRPVVQNPAVRFYEWSGSRGKLEYYDKEKSERISVKLPFKFIVLDELHTITGYSDQDTSGFWSNETRRTSEDFTVRTKRGIKYVGSYKNDRGIKQTPVGAKYTKSIYIAQKLDDEWVIANLKLSGAALNAWIDLAGKHKLEGNITAVTGHTEGTKGATVYQIPTFEYGGAPKGDDLQIATALDDQLQTYLDTYLSAPKYDDNAEPIYEDSFNTDDGKATPEQLADFEKRRAKLADKGEDEEIKEKLDNLYPDNEPINLDDIPF